MTISLEYPSGPVALDSPFYVSRPPVEEQAYQEITKPGSLIRIKAPKEMGKSSLMLRINHHAKSLGYHTALVDCQQIDTADLKNVDRFLRAFCIQVSHALHLKPNLDEYWDEDLGSKINCTLYFQYYLLENIDQPLLLSIHQLDRVFEYPELAQEFLPLLRSWFEEAKQVETWSKLRLLVVYSTELYVPLKINQSPFNIGWPLTLPEFTSQQVQHLATLHGLNWDSRQSEQLMAMVGGHPMLIRLALYHLAQSPQLSLANLLKSAATDIGIYREHLRRYLANLQSEPELARVLLQVIFGKYLEEINPILSYKLESLGLVKFSQQKSIVRCHLYSIYFKNLLKTDKFTDIFTQNQVLRDRMLELEKAMQEFEKLSRIDSLTHVANRRYFQEYLQQQWEQLAKTRNPLSIIFCDLDNFKSYNDTCGHSFGDRCLKKIAKILQKNVSRKNDLVGRYGGDEFVIILPDTNAQQSMMIATKIRKDVENLNLIVCSQSQGNPTRKTQVTVSLGVASTIPDSSNFAEILVSAADQALYESKKASRNCVSLSKILNFGAEINH